MALFPCGASSGDESLVRGLNLRSTVTWCDAGLTHVVEPCRACLHGGPCIREVRVWKGLERGSSVLGFNGRASSGKAPASGATYRPRCLSTALPLEEPGEDPSTGQLPILL
jgi:hypothetical protein